MAMVRASEDAGDWSRDEASPLTRAMADIALCVLRSIVVRSPVISFDEEYDGRGRDAQMYELEGRTGIKLRAPFMLLSWERRLRAARGGTEAEPRGREVRARA